MAALYDESYYGRDRQKFVGLLEAAIQTLTVWKWKRLRSLLAPGDGLLDVGCGRGSLVQLARQEGVEAYGIERASPLKHSSPYIFDQDLPECRFPDGRFQLVVLWHVLEHLRGPVETLEEIRRILKPGGWLSVAVPNFGGAQARASGAHWFHLDLPRHFWHFRPRSLQHLLESHGFRLVSWSTWSLEYDWFGTLQSWMSRAFDDRNRLYSLLKREAPQPVLETMRRVAAASALALPALGSSLWDAARGQGGTLTVIAQKIPSGKASP
ncbi:MAG: class I SAM-dependent methyltransferase [Acidobacteria bacterium]|nr:class I SAM-dependent methyltransferase [Acidobacteriota bacterium]